MATANQGDARVFHSFTAKGVAPSDSADTLTVTDPWAGTTAARLVPASEGQIAGAVEAATTAFRANEWETRHRRAGWLDAAAAAIEADRDALVDLMVRHIGKPVKAAGFEVGRSAAFLRACARHALEIGGETVPLDSAPNGAGRHGIAERVPLGVILGITPFNAPANLLVQKVAPALATGNAIIVKPAPEGAAVALRVAAAFREAGVPDGLFQVLLGGADEALALAAHPAVAAVTLTGGTAAGEAVARAAGAKPFLGELGGNSANIVCDDADIEDAAARIAPSAYEASGQQCISTQRIIVDRRVRPAFEAALLARIDALSAGDPGKPETDLGPVVHARAADRIMAMVEAATAAGARLLREPRREGCLIHPTLLCDAPRDARVVREEIFGPVAVLMEADGFEQAVAIANECEFGLQAACFTARLDRAMAAGRLLRAGSVWINEASRFRLDNYPFGGFGKSGSGREGIKYAMEEMTTWKFLGIRLPGGYPA